MTVPASEVGPAIFSDDRRYRYTLTRVWDEAGKTVAFIGLNPSTANERALDPTLRRCLRFAHDWGYGRFVMLNLFAYRTRDPMVMKAATHPVDAPGANLNDTYIVVESKTADLVVACWGVHGLYKGRDQEVRDLLAAAEVPVNHLGLTRNGHPKHPLYLSSKTRPRPWLTKAQARGLWDRLHTQPKNGYERGYCHCDNCDGMVQQLVTFFDVRRPDGPWSPVQEVRIRARTLGWPG